MQSLWGIVLVIGLVGLSSAWMRHAARKPAMVLPKGSASSNVLRFPRLMKFIGWAGAVVFLWMLAMGVSGAIREPGPAWLFLTPVLAVVLWLIQRYIRYANREVYFDDAALTLRDGRKTLTIPWSEVKSVGTTALAGELEIKNAQGEVIVIHKLFIGARTFVEQLRQRVPEGLWYSALRYYDPTA